MRELDQHQDVVARLGWHHLGLENRLLTSGPRLPLSGAEAWTLEATYSYPAAPRHPRHLLKSQPKYVLPSPSKTSKARRPRAHLAERHAR